jgi:hypothetical protein
MENHRCRCLQEFKARMSCFLTIRDVGQSVAIGDKHFEVVKECVTPTNDVSLDIQRRIQTANRCFFGPKTKTSRLRYAGHMIGRPEDLPRKALFRAKPNEKRNQGRPNSRWADGVTSDSLALGGYVLQQALTRYWL